MHQLYSKAEAKAEQYCCDYANTAGQMNLELSRESVHKPHAATPTRAGSHAGRPSGRHGAGSRVRHVQGPQLRLSKLLQFLVGGGAIMEVTMEDLE
jgi:hypothetical protein